MRQQPRPPADLTNALEFGIIKVSFRLEVGFFRSRATSAKIERGFVASEQLNRLRRNTQYRIVKVERSSIPHYTPDFFGSQERFDFSLSLF